jgi:hypothetical protein
MLSYLDSRWLSIDGRAWHAQNGTEIDDLCFDFFRFAGRFSDGHAGLTGFSGLRNTKRYFGVACMMEWAGKNFMSGIAELFDAAWLGLEFARPSHSLGHIPPGEHGYNEVTKFEGILRSTLAVFFVLTLLECVDGIDGL